MSAGARSLYLPSLDGLRCVAILPVFLSHALMAAGIPRFIPGNFGVTLFFFLSGYLITTLMRLELESTGTISIRHFYLRRALRIFPTCYLVLAACGLYGLATGWTDLWYLLGQALHLTNYQIIRSGWLAPIAPHTDVYWSLAVEEHFYLAFPALFLLFARGASRRWLVPTLWTLCAMVFAWRCVLTFALGASYDRTYLATDTRIDSILFGCILALHGNPALDPTRLKASTWKTWLLPLSLVGLILSFVVGDRAFRETFGYSIQGLCLFAVFVTAVRYPEWGPLRWLSAPAVRYIGVLSYSIYLVHPAMLALAEALVGKGFLALTATAAVATLAVAALLHRCVERPLARVRKRYSALDAAEGGAHTARTPATDRTAASPS